MEDYKDWKNTTFGESISGVPDACCKRKEETCGEKVFSTKGADGINQEGCLKLLEEFVVANVAIIGGVAIAITILQIIGVLISCMLANSMRHSTCLEMFCCL